MSGAEKVMLGLLADIHKATVKSGEIDADFVHKALFNNAEWAFSWELSGMVSDEDFPTPDYVYETASILSAWRHIEASYKHLDDADKATVRDAIGSEPEFQGFDGNNETEHFSAALVMIQDLKRFDEFAGRSCNSHSPSLHRHRQVVERTKEKQDLRQGELLDKDDLIDILKR
ncbi:YfbU family protein [Thalassospira sp. CH_XMU1458]|uniref:YfbU family protein n=1 Tax=Thalassospira sp. CH_XMU1458 TaxID=3107776 RepID=UPI00300C0327